MRPYTLLKSLFLFYLNFVQSLRLPKSSMSKARQSGGVGRIGWFDSSFVWTAQTREPREFDIVFLFVAWSSSTSIQKYSTRSASYLQRYLSCERTFNLTSFGKTQTLIVRPLMSQLYEIDRIRRSDLLVGSSRILSLCIFVRSSFFEE